MNCIIIFPRVARYAAKIVIRGFENESEKVDLHKQENHLSWQASREYRLLPFYCILRVKKRF